MDTFTPEMRSWIMAQVKSKNARSTEGKFLAVLREHGITGWRRNYPLHGKPDFTFPRERVAVFIDGCFWHGHPTRCRIPKTNRAYWMGKIERNRKRDREVRRVLRSKDWRVLRVWEHEVTHASTLRRLKKALNSA